MQPNVKKASTLVIFISWLAYTTAYVGRINFGASTVAIIDDLQITKEQAGLVSSLFFFCYGAGQLINGILSQKYNTRISVFFALFFSSIINFTMARLNSITAMGYLWALNGFVQSVLWSSIIKTQSERVDAEYISKSILALATTVAVGRFVTYIASSAFIYAGSWRLIFYFASALLMSVSFIWLFLIKKAPIMNVAQEKINLSDSAPLQKPKKKLSVAAFATVVIVFIAAVSNGFMNDGINLWFPSLLKENFGVPNYISVIITLALPIVAIFGAFAASFLWRNLKKNSPLIIFISYGLCLLLLVLVYITFGQFLVLTVLLFAFLSLMLASMNNTLTSIIPLTSSAGKKSGVLAGTINTACYIGSTLGSFVLAAVVEGGGWLSGIKLLAAISAIAAVSALLLFATRKIKKQKNGQHI